MEIADLLAKELGLELVIKDMAFESVCAEVQLGHCDIAMAGLTINEARKELVNFSNPYYDAYQHIIVPAGNNEFDGCQTAADVENILKAKDKSCIIGVQEGTTGHKYVDGDEDWGFEGYKNLTCKGFRNGSMAVTDMLNGSIDYVIIDSAPAERIVESINAVQ